MRGGCCVTPEPRGCSPDRFRYAIERGYAIGVQLTPTPARPRFLAALAPVREGRCEIAIGSRYVAHTAYHARCFGVSACCCSRRWCGWRSDAASPTPPGKPRLDGG
jgi:hypothetical protein